MLWVVPVNMDGGDSSLVYTASPSEVSDYQAGPNHGQNEWWCLMKGEGLHNAEEAYFPLTKLPWVQFSRVLLLMLLIFIDGTP